MSCDLCGVKYTLRTSPSKIAKRKYCSAECQRKCRITRILKPCDMCKKLFYVEPHRFKSGRGKFCSKRCYSKFGFSEETKSAMSKKRKGVPNPAVAGEKSHFWKGGVTPKHRAIRTSLRYRLWRTSVFERDDFTCQICKARGVQLQADHIKPFATFPALRFDIDNGRTLCVSCHRKTDTYGCKTNFSSQLKPISNGI